MRHDISEARAMPLIWVSRLGNGVWQSEVANSIGIRAATLADMITQLEAAKLIERREDPKDQRAKALWLTEEGTALAAKLEDVLCELHEDILSDFDVSELEIATKILRRISMRQPKSNRFFANRRERSSHPGQDRARESNTKF
ncbi:MarR family winged helix-turn-helix transcriptional regulator [Mesorhizobium sp. UC22_110]|jgi:MarR family transcriptional regulator for hemolysin|uniref:MarR family winged helix-turn-helix transcriptional regulator n=1 Tax=unclassified Mesorhizobium TaxID=325217 RepID=UPI003672ED88